MLAGYCDVKMTSLEGGKVADGASWLWRVDSDVLPENVTTRLLFSVDRCEGASLNLKRFFAQCRVFSLQTVLVRGDNCIRNA